MQNSQAVGVYRRMGFVETGRFPSGDFQANPEAAIFENEVFDLLSGGIHQPELSPDVGGLGSERGTVVPGKVAYRTFLHVGTVRRDHSLRWQQSAYVVDFL